MALLLLVGLAWEVGLMSTQALAQDAAAAAPSEATPQITFTFERAGFTIPRFTLEIDRGGQGRYIGEEAAQVVRGVAAEPAMQPFDRSFTISAKTTNRIFTLAQQLDHFHVTCASKAKNIADTGSKTLRYSGPDGSGSCTYNFAEEKNVQEITTLFEAIAGTMDKGRELDRLHRYDRLGLDEAMAALKDDVAGGRAMELGTIAPTLQAIAGDAEVLQRVRITAAALLNLIPQDAVGR